MVPLPAVGLFAGRIGNFINGELWGKPTDLPWGMRVGDEVLHPSQLYEAGLEGIVLFMILWWFTSKPRPRLAPAGLFLTLYAIFRILVEFVRVPDQHIGYLAFDWLTMGQLLSLPVLAAGLAMLAHAYAQTAQTYKAETCFEEATRISTLSETYLNYAQLLVSQKRTSEAREWAQKVLQKRPTMPSYLRRRERPWFRKANALLKRLPEK